MASGAGPTSIAASDAHGARAPQEMLKHELVAAAFERVTSALSETVSQFKERLDGLDLVSILPTADFANTLVAIEELGKHSSACVKLIEELPPLKENLALTVEVHSTLDAILQGPRVKINHALKSSIAAKQKDLEFAIAATFDVASITKDDLKVIVAKHHDHEVLFFHSSNQDSWEYLLQPTFEVRHLSKRMLRLTWGSDPEQKVDLETFSALRWYLSKHHKTEMTAYEAEWKHRNEEEFKHLMERMKELARRSESMAKAVAER